MKWTLLSLLLALGISAIKADPTIYCFGNDTTAAYTVQVSITNPTGDDFNRLENCATAHSVNKTDADVKRIVMLGTSKNIPSVLCKSFPNAVELEAVTIDLEVIININKCENLEILNLSDNKIPKIQANQFSNTKLRRINLSKNHIKRTDDDSLYNMENSLEDLNLSENPVIEIEPNFFQHAKSLKKLDISSCGLDTIETDWMRNISSLVELNISNNPDLESIPPTIFWNLHKLEMLLMNSNGLRNLSPQQFYYNTVLEYLDISFNDFSTLEENIFENQASLITLWLSGNSFEKLPEEIFSNLTSLQALYMERCNLENLSTNWFKILEELRVLDLSYNSIKKLPYKTFSVENNLEHLYLNNNGLTILDATAFALLRKLKALRVDNNKINAVDNHFLQQPTRLQTAWFSNNECVDINIDDFYIDQEDNLAYFEKCFNNFDKIPIVMDTVPEEPYRWYSMRWKTLVFHIRAHSNVSLAFSDIQSEDLGESLKIKIGMDRNLNTYIHEGGSIVWSRNTSNILDENEWRSFVVSWDYDVLQFYKEGWQLPRAMHIIKKPFEINFVGVRADTPASFVVQRIEDNFLHENFPSLVEATTPIESTTTS